jgi:hypothetical protein
MEVIDITKKILETNNAVGSAVDFNDAIQQLDLEGFILKTIGIVADQVTSVCTETGQPLFDVVRARILRNKIKDAFDAIMEVIDEEIKEYS